MTQRPYLPKATKLATALTLAVVTLSAGSLPVAAQQGRPIDAKTAPGKKNEGRQIELRRKWFVESRGLDKLPNAQAYRSQALTETKARLARQVSINRAAGEVWTPIGPAAMKMGNWAMGPVSGRITALTPQPGNDNIVYIGSAGGGVWKTSNAGASWTPLFDEVGTQPVGSIMIEPDATQNVWVGTGDRNRGCQGYYGDGIYFSADGGTSWTRRNGSGSAAINVGVITSLVRHPSNTNVVLAAGSQGRDCKGDPGDRGIFRTTDRGASWTKVLDQTIEDIVFVPNSQTVFASGPNVVFKSTDGGVNWNNITGAIAWNPSGARARLAVAPSDPNTVYVLTNDDLYRSTDGGASWTLRNDRACQGQCDYDLALAVHPTNPNELLVGSIEFARSTDGGQTLNYLSGNWGNTQRVHQDTHVLRYSTQNSNRWWVGSDGGVWRTEDGSVSWVNMNSNLNITQFHDVTPHPDNADIVYGGAQDNSSSRRTTSNVWELTAETSDGFANLFDGANPDVIFQASYNYQGVPWIFRSIQGGAEGTFDRVPIEGLGSGEDWGFKMTMATAGSHVFLTSNRVYRALTTASPFVWTPVSDRLSAWRITALLPTRVGSATPTYAGSEGGEMFYTRDAAAAPPTWVNIKGNLPDTEISDIAVDPTNLQRVFVLQGKAKDAGLYRSTSGGTTWTKLGEGLPQRVAMQSVAIDPLNINRIFVGTDIGVYSSNDGGANFEPFMAGFPIGTPVQDLEVDNQPHVLVAGTFGRGAWKVPLETNGNQLPVAGFNQVANGLTVSFTDSSTDADGSIVSRHWNFGDGTSSSATHPSKTYAAGGSYTVTLTVTDNIGGVNSVTRTVSVKAPNELGNGEPVNGLSAAAGSELRYTMQVPTGASGLRFTTTGSNGNADVYARFGSPPTTSNYTCRSIASGSNETCSIPSTQAGTYHVLVKATSAFSGLSLTGSHGYVTSYSNNDDVAIGDNTTVESPITVSGRRGNAPANALVSVAIAHTYIGDLKVDLVAPSGRVYVLHNRTGDSANDINQDYTVNLSSEPLNGVWKLRANDNSARDTGRIDSWSITF